MSQIDTTNYEDMQADPVRDEPDPAPREYPEYVEVVGIRFKEGGKTYYFDPSGLSLEKGQDVIIDTARGVEYGVCAEGNHRVPGSKIVPPLRKVLRAATEQDARTLEENRQKEARAFEICQQKIIEHNLDMKLVDVEYSFDGSKILFFFTSDGRVDFRELVKNLASVFRTRIELRQIGVRDEAKMLGGLGICGRPFCCCSFLDDFQPVSIKMAKTQSLSLNPTKISGTCGRLMCCLKYEQDAYEDMIKSMPKNESFVQTPDGKGTVSEINLLKSQVKVRLDNDPENPRCYENCQLNILRNGKAARGAKAEAPQEQAPAALPKDHPVLNEKEFLAQLEAEPQPAPEKPRIIKRPERAERPQPPEVRTMDQAEPGEKTRPKKQVRHNIKKTDSPSVANSDGLQNAGAAHNAEKTERSGQRRNYRHNRKKKDNGRPQQ